MIKRGFDCLSHGLSVITPNSLPSFLVAIPLHTDIKPIIIISSCKWASPGLQGNRQGMYFAITSANSLSSGSKGENQYKKGKSTINAVTKAPAL